MFFHNENYEKGMRQFCHKFPQANPAQSAKPVSQWRLLIFLVGNEGLGQDSTGSMKLECLQNLRQAEVKGKAGLFWWGWKRRLRSAQVKRHRFKRWLPCSKWRKRGSWR